jgi:hypothetical protein
MLPLFHAAQIAPAIKQSAVFPAHVVPARLLLKAKAKQTRECALLLVANAAPVLIYGTPVRAKPS